MKNLLNKKFIIFSCICYIVLLGFRVNNPPDGFTGAPGESTCASCHAGGNPNLDGEVFITGIPSTIEANTTYNVTVTVTNPNMTADEGGFQMVVLDEADDNSGNLSNPGPFSELDPDDGRTYFEHRPAQDFNGNTEVTYTVDWTAPAGPNNELITFYAAANISNGNNTTTLDRIVTVEFEGTLDAPVDPLEVSILNIMDVSCVGASDGSADAVVTGGTPPYSYLWDNGETNAQAVMLTAGMHSVTVTDDTQATATAAAIVGMPPVLSLNIDATTDVLCNGDANGSATVSGNGGTPGYTYSWPGGGSGPTQNNLSAGSYVVTVTDQNNCTATNTVVIDEPDVLALNILQSSDVTCFGEMDGTASLLGSGGTSPYSYMWPDGNVNATRLNLGPGNYTVTVTDQNNCTATNTVIIDEPDALVPNASATDESAPGQMDGTATANPTGGVEPYDYLWSNNASTQTIVNLSPGDYTVTVTDANGCTASQTVTVQGMNCNLTISVDNDTLACNGDANGQLIVVISGQSDPVTISWSTGSNNDTISNLIAGNYSVTVTDNDGCTAVIDSAMVVEPIILEFTTDSVIHVACFGDSTGSIFITTMGGTPPYNYLWSNGDTTEDINNLTVGFYELTVTDANGCQSSACEEITQPMALTVNAGATNETDIGAGDGTATANPAGGTAPYTYLWSNDSTTQMISGLSPGMYTVTVTDINNCTGEETVVVGSDGCPLMVTATTIDVLCFGDATGAINLSLSGETEPVSFIWSTGDTTQNIADLTAGAYSVTVADANCMVSLDTVIFENNAIDVNISLIMAPECPDSSDGKIVVTSNASGAMYTWSTGAITDTLCDLTAGQYCVTVTDVNGCETSACFDLVAMDTIAPTALANDLTLFIDENGNSPAIQFADFDAGSFDNCSMVSLVEEVDTFDCSDLGDNTVVFIISDSSGNTSTGSFVTTVEDTLAPVIQLKSTEVYADAGGNFNPINFSDVDAGSSDNCGAFTTDMGSIQYNCLDVGTQTLTVTLTDNAGNTSSSETTIEVRDTFPPSVICVMDMTVNICDGVEYFPPITSDNCGAPVPQLISGLESGSSFPIGTTEIVFRATDAAGNTAECNFNITVDVDLAVQLDPTDATCFDFSDGQIAYNISGGTAPYNFDLEPIQQDTTSLHAGKYFVTVTDAAGCFIRDSFEIGEPEILFISDFEIIDEEADLPMSGAIDITVSGGTPDYSYSWTKDGEFFSNDEDLIDLSAGNYVVEVTDAQGCTFISDTLEVDFISSIIDPVLDASVDIYPNPNDGNFVIKIEDLQLTELDIEVYHPMGEKVMSSTEEIINGEIRYSHSLSSGLYIIVIKTSNKMTVRRFIVSR